MKCAAVLVVLAGVVGACGRNRDLPPSGPIPREVYEIAASDVPAPGKFLRYAEPGPKGGGLDIAVTTYEPAGGEGPSVTLVGVVHVADAPYYEAVQRELDRHDVVLYEGVTPKGLSAGDWQRRALEKSGAAGEMQREIAQWFGFRYQLDAIDYGRANLVHADMDLEEFLEKGGDRLGFKAEKDDLAPDVREAWSKAKEWGHLALATPGPLQSLARKIFAKTMGSGDVGTDFDLVPGLSDLVLRQRNEVVIRVLKEQVARRKSGSIAVFYGAAHMSDLARRLESELGYRRASGTWLRAWGLRPPIA